MAIRCCRRSRAVRRSLCHGASPGSSRSRTGSAPISAIFPMPPRYSLGGLPARPCPALALGACHMRAARDAAFDAPEALQASADERAGREIASRAFARHNMIDFSVGDAPHPRIRTCRTPLSGADSGSGTNPESAGRLFDIGIVFWNQRVLGRVFPTHVGFVCASPSQPASCLCIFSRLQGVLCTTVPLENHVGRGQPYREKRFA